MVITRKVAVLIAYSYTVNLFVYSETYLLALLIICQHEGRWNSVLVKYKVIHTARQFQQLIQHIECKLTVTAQEKALSGIIGCSIKTGLFLIQ